jgi:hypothetical protein
MHGGPWFWTQFPDGTSQTDVQVSSTGIPPGEEGTWALSVDQNDGGQRTMQAHRHNGTNWVSEFQVRDPLLGVFDSSAPVRIGGHYNEVANRFGGRIYSVELRTGLDPAGAARYLAPNVGVAYTPDTADMQITGTVRLTMRAQVDSFVAAAFPSLLFKGDTGREFLFYLTTPGDNYLVFSASDATAYTDYYMSPVVLGQPLTVGIEFTSGSTAGAAYADGVRQPVTFYTAPVIPNTTQPVIVGNSGGAANANATGRIFWAQLEKLSGPGGSSTGVVWRFDAADAPTDATTTTWTDPRGRAWTVTNPQAISGRTMWKFDAEDYPGTGTVYTDPRGRAWTLTDAAAIAKSYR